MKTLDKDFIFLLTLLAAMCIMFVGGFGYGYLVMQWRCVELGCGEWIVEDIGGENVKLFKGTPPETSSYIRQVGETYNLAKY